MVNVPFYAMEIRHQTCKNLTLIVGEIGPVEAELIFSTLFFLTGAVFGGDSVDQTLALATGLNYDVLTTYKVKHVLILILFLLELVFIWDNLKESIVVNPSETIRLLYPVFILLGLTALHSQLPSFEEETVVVYILYQLIFSIIILNLMLFNMSGKPFNTILIGQYVYALIPISAFLLFKVSPQIEILITRASTMCVALEFAWTVYRISRQYVQHHKIAFFTIKQ